MDKLTVRSIAEAINESIPEVTQEEWDNSGVQIYIDDREVNKILVCLEVTEEVADEAMISGVDMIVCHHPLIFGDIRNIDGTTSYGRTLIKLIRAGISVYASHTPFDRIEGGNSDVLADLLGLTEVAPLGETDGMDMCRTGFIPTVGKMKLEFFTTYVAKCLEIDSRSIRGAGDLDRGISKVAVCSGAGTDFAVAAAAAGCDVLVTGDVKHHQALEAKSIGICIVDAGHYDTEKFFAGVMKKRLAEILGDSVEISESRVNTDPFVC
ncbi:MAG: Nif3-like dinuclear metal center hexameric protein [Lentihominibacter sp.]|jgi:dinuclear metal center YbgI/SA1388 family protein